MVSQIHQRTVCNLAVCVKDVATAAIQLAIQMIAAAGAVYAAWILVPPFCQSFVLSFGTVAAVSLGALVFAQSGPFRARVVAPNPLPPEAPCGLENGGQNCAINSVIQFFEANPFIAQWIRHLPREETDLETFGQFAEQYHPPANLWGDFVNHFRGLPEEGRESVRTAFNTYLRDLAPPNPSPLHNFKEIFEGIYRFGNAHQNLLLLYDQKPEFVKGSQQVRLALHQINQAISESPYDQVDAAEVKETIFKLLPDQQKMRLETTYQYEMRGKPPMRYPSAPKVDLQGTIPLGFRDDDPHPNFNQMFRHFLQNSDLEPRTEIGIDGERHQYTIQQVTTRFLEAPPALYFQINRFGAGMGPKSWLSQWLPSCFPPTGFRLFKKQAAIQVPSLVSIPLPDGSNRRYRLVSFVHHSGNSPDSGHYMSGMIRNGQKYFMNDRRVRRATDLEWNQMIKKAYLFSYLPVEE